MVCICGENTTVVPEEFDDETDPPKAYLPGVGGGVPDRIASTMGTGNTYSPGMSRAGIESLPATPPETKPPLANFL